MTDREEGQPEPLLAGRGLLLVDAFRSATGLSLRQVETLLEDGRLEGVFVADGRWHGIFDDALPTRDDLLGWGLTVDPAYDPELLRSHHGPPDDEDDDRDDDEAGDGTWTMRW